MSVPQVINLELLIIIYHQLSIGVKIVRDDGMVMNNYSGFGHYIEFVPAVINTTGVFGDKDISTNNTGATATNASSSSGSGAMPISKKDNLTAAFGEWALLDSEVVPVQKVMEKYNWTQTALHHHMLGETPKVLFLHWAVTKSYRYNKSSQGNHYANIYIPKYYWANTYT